MYVVVHLWISFNLFQQKALIDGTIHADIKSMCSSCELYIMYSWSLEHLISIHFPVTNRFNRFNFEYLRADRCDIVRKFAMNCSQMGNLFYFSNLFYCLLFVNEQGPYSRVKPKDANSNKLFSIFNYCRKHECYYYTFYPIGASSLSIVFAYLEASDEHELFPSSPKYRTLWFDSGNKIC